MGSAVQTITAASMAREPAASRVFLARAYRVTSYPTSLFVSADAVITEVVFGSMSAVALEHHLAGILP